VALATGEARVLRSSDFRAAPEEQLASKGGAFVLRPNEVSLELGAVRTRLSSYGGVVGGRYAYHWDEWSASFGVSGGYGLQSTSAENVKLASIGGDAAIERRWSLEPFVLSLGVGAEGDVFWQTLERTDAARVAAAGYPTTQHYTGFAPGPIALTRLRAPLGASPWVEIALRGGVLFPNFGDGVGALYTARAGVDTGIDF
jgi:hypothetical protein